MRSLQAGFFERHKDEEASLSFQSVYDAGEIKWLETAKRRIDEKAMPTSMECNDLSSYSSVLGEMRAFADLLKMPEFEVSSFGTGAKGPDFLLTKKYDGSRVYVEVFTSPPRPDNEIVIKEGRKECFYDEKGVKYSIETTISVQEPFGFPKLGKPGESTTANAVSKICAIKHSEYQLDDNAESILYFDTQSLAMSFTMLEQSSSVLEFNGAFTSGAIWLAYYGEKGFPILENAGAGVENCSPVLKMSLSPRLFSAARSKRRRRSQRAGISLCRRSPEFRKSRIRLCLPDRKTCTMP